MSTYKDLWFDEFERLYNEGLDEGLPDEMAYDAAGEKADAAAMGRLSDLADRLRQQKKDEQS